MLTYWGLELKIVIFNKKEVSKCQIDCNNVSEQYDAVAISVDKKCKISLSILHTHTQIKAYPKHITIIQAVAAGAQNPVREINAKIKNEKLNILLENITLVN